MWRYYNVYVHLTFWYVQLFSRMVKFEYLNVGRFSSLSEIIINPQIVGVCNVYFSDTWKTIFKKILIDDWMIIVKLFLISSKLHGFVDLYCCSGNYFQGKLASRMNLEKVPNIGQIMECDFIAASRKYDTKWHNIRLIYIWIDLGAIAQTKINRVFLEFNFFGKTTKSLFTKLCFCCSHIALVQK